MRFKGHYRESSRCFFLFIGVLLFVSCHNVPPVSNGRMQDILYEIHKAEGVLQAKNIGVDREDVYLGAMTAVLDKYNITPEEFDSALVWYTAHPKRFEIVYPQVIGRLEKEMSRLPSPDDELVLKQQVYAPTSQFVFINPRERVYAMFFGHSEIPLKPVFQYRYLRLYPEKTHFYIDGKYKFLFIKID